MRKLNDMFHIADEQLIKTSNGQPVPLDEPLFILRARDLVAVAVLQDYRDHCWAVGVPPDRIKQLDEVILEFVRYRNSHPTKTPGITHGA